MIHLSTPEIRNLPARLCDCIFFLTERHEHNVIVRLRFEGCCGMKGKKIQARLSIILRFSAESTHRKWRVSSVMRSVCNSQFRGRTECSLDSIRRLRRVISFRWRSRARRGLCAGLNSSHQRFQQSRRLFKRGIPGEGTGPKPRTEEL